jgi:hypothetical protein
MDTRVIEAINYENREINSGGNKRDYQEAKSFRRK